MARYLDPLGKGSLSKQAWHPESPPRDVEMEAADSSASARPKKHGDPRKNLACSWNSVCPFLVSVSAPLVEINPQCMTLCGFNPCYS